MKKALIALISIILVFGLCLSLAACDSKYAKVNTEYDCCGSKITLAAIKEGAEDFEEDDYKYAEDEKLVTLIFVPKENSITDDDFGAYLEDDEAILVNGKYPICITRSASQGENDILYLKGEIKILVDLPASADINKLQLKIKP